VSVKRLWFRRYMHELGFEWIATMKIGSGCKLHLADGELPMGRLIVSVSKHYTAVIDGVLHDTHDPRRKPVRLRLLEDRTGVLPPQHDGRVKIGRARQRARLLCAACG
jgi:hypothetical protein